MTSTGYCQISKNIVSCVIDSRLNKHLHLQAFDHGPGLGQSSDHRCHATATTERTVCILGLYTMVFHRRASLTFPPRFRSPSFLYRSLSRANPLLLWIAILAVAFGVRSGAEAQQLQVLRQHVRAEVSDHRAALAGAMPADQQIHASIVLPLRNQAALTSLLSRLYDPSSPDYRHFLSVAQFTDQFGPSNDDFQAVVAFAQANGLTLGDLPANRLVVPFVGTVSQINTAFNVQMNVYQHPTESRTFFSPDREPSLNLSVPVDHISGLDDFSKPRHMSVLGPSNQQAATVLGSGPGGSYLGSDMRAAYYGGTTLTGNGQAIGLVEFGGYSLSDVNLTFSNAGQTYNVPINNVLLDGATGAPTESDAEETLDIVQAVGMAPGLSQVRVYIGVGSDDANVLNSMASENLAKQLSCSWGWRPADPTAADVFFEEMAAQGQSFFTSSGDSGAFDAAINPFFYPAEDQYVTAVGGTHLATSSAGGSWVSETVWNSQGDGSGGGISPDSISIPSWQVGLATSANGGSSTLRNVPDVAMEGDFDNYACALGVCEGTYAGTSFAAPRWAGFMALVNQQAVESGNAPNGGLGFINPTLYRLAQVASSTDFHDITVGNNDTDNQPLWFSAVAGYDLTTGWGSANGQSLINDLAGPQVPGFWLGSAQSTIPVNPGGTGTATLSVTDAGGFTGSVNLAVSSALPTGVTASFSPNPATGSSVLTLTATNSAPSASQAITITGTSGTLTASTNVTVAVHAPSFTLAASPAAVGINQSASGTSTITVLPLYGFTSAVNLSIAGLPSGVTAAFSPASTTGTSTLTLTASNTATPGTSTLTITGTSGSLTATTSVSLSIHGPSFILYGGAVNVGQGSTGNTYIDVIDEYGFTGSVNLVASGLPNGVTASFSPNPTTGSSTVTFTASSSATVGQSVVTITGTSGVLTATTTVNLGVYAPTFTLSGGGSLNIGQGSSATSYVYVNPEYGFTGSVNLSVSGLPSGVTALWTPNPTTSNSTLTLAANSSAKAGQYNLTITGISGSQSATTTLTLGIYAPTFTLSTYSSVNIGQGTSGTAYFYVTPEYGFTGSVNLAASGLPSGVTASFSPNPTTGTSLLTLQASSTATLGQYTVTITGTSGTQTATTTLTLGVYVPTFTLSNYGGITVGQGASSSGYINVTPEYGFTGSVTMAVSGLPSGVTASFSPNPTTGSSTLTVNANSIAAVGQYTLTVTGTSGTQTASTMVTLGVYKPTFTLYSSGSVTVGQGASTSTYVDITPQYGFTGSVTMSVSGLPSGVTASFSPNPTTGNSQLTVTANSTATLGQYTLTITGTSGSLQATTNLTLGVYVPTFSISGPYSVSVGQGTSFNSYVYVSSQYGFTGSVSLSASGLPTGVTASFSPATTTYYSSLTLNIGATAPVGTSTVTITGTSGSQTQTVTFQLSIYPPSFTIYSSNSSLSLNAGASGTTYVYITPQYGFSSGVTFSASGLPSGVTASFSPNPATGSSTMTLSASSTAAAGQTTLTITGTSGSATATTPITLTVNAPDFTVTDAPSAVYLFPGASEKSTVTAVSQYGFSGNVNYAVSGLPSGVTASFAPNPSSTSSTLTLTASPGAAPASTTATITGTSGSLTATAPLAVTIRSTQTSSATALSLTAGGSSVSTVASGTLVTATATVSAGSAPLTAGQVNFCDATATYCDPVHLLGSAQLTSGGTASLQFIPGAGSHSYKAVFVGTNANATSTSATSTLAVTASQASTTTIAQIGSTGNYTLIATVTGQGPVAPSGNVSFLDSTDGNFSLGSAQLTSGAATLSMSVAQSPTVGSEPESVATGDFNGDGIPDLAVTNLNANIITILLGKGDGTFNTVASLQTGGATNVVAVGDFNRDGHLDLAVTLSNSSSVNVFLGNGDGTFTPSNSSPPTGSEPAGIVVGDYNGDGLLDLAVVNSGSSTVTILLGNGDGTFTAASLSPVVGDGPRSIVRGDFNGDGVQDLAVANIYSNNVSILLGAGDGTFALADTIPTGSYPASLVTGDLNGDGKLDLAVSNESSSNVTVLLGNGDGTFTTAASPSTGSYPLAIAMADLNGDGKADLVTANYYGSNTTVLLGNGDGTFAAGVSSLVGSDPVALAIGDWNGDGVKDVAVVNSGTNNLTILTSQLAQRATASASGISPVGRGQHAVDANFVGNSVYAASTSRTTTLTAEIGAPAVTLSLSPVSVTTAQALTVTIAVSGGSANPIPTGSVTLSTGSYTSTATILAGGSAAIVVPADTLPIGTDPLSVNFTPDSASISTYTSATGSGSIVVTNGTPVLTWATPAAITYGSALSGAQLNASSSVAGSFSYSPAIGTVLAAGAQTLSVTVKPTDTTHYQSATSTVVLTVNKAALAISSTNATRVFGAANPSFTGTVTGAVNGDTLSETFTTTATASSGVGTYPIIPAVTGTNSGDYTIAPTNGVLTVTTASTTTGLLLSNTNLTFTATVTPAASGVPTGTVSFYSGQTLLGTGTLSNGVGSYTATAFPTGDVNLTAQYSGDANFAQSASASIAVLAVSPANSSLTVPASGTVSDVLTFATVHGYSGTLQLTCTGLPQNASCTFAPSSIAFSGGASSATSTITISTGVVASLTSPPSPFGSSRATAWAALGLPSLIALGLAIRRRKVTFVLRTIAMLLLLCAAASSLIGCGGSTGPSTSTVAPSSPAGNYTVQVVSTGSSGLTQTTSLNVTVQ